MASYFIQPVVTHSWIVIVSKKGKRRNFPRGPVAKTPHSQCRGPGFNPWPGN